MVYKIMLFLCIFLFTIQGLGASKNDDLVATLFRLCNYDEIEGLSFQEIQQCQVSTFHKGLLVDLRNRKNLSMSRVKKSFPYFFEIF